MEKEVIETRTSKIWLGEDGIVRNIIVPQAEVTLNDAKEYIDIQLKITRNKRSPTFIDLRKIKSADRKARNHYSSNESKAINSAIGMLIDSSISRVIGYLFIGINNP